MPPKLVRSPPTVDMACVLFACVLPLRHGAVLQPHQRGLDGDEPRARGAQRGGQGGVAGERPEPFAIGQRRGVKLGAARRREHVARDGDEALGVCAGGVCARGGGPRGVCGGGELGNAGRKRSRSSSGSRSTSKS
ncbi:hypothetical protein M885DRAFT_627240 [Pelagophyceae sp. CCMP2097]|nr:hypothetical protein M885DRAFT_627240 [Pelagophyceae sp. CCMP2097]